MIQQNNPKPKQRHGCLTAFLVLMLIANAVSTSTNFFGMEAMKAVVPGMPNWGFPILIACGIFNLVCAVALFRWKKWGFWGFVFSASVILIVNLISGVNPAQAAIGFVGIAILYGVLQIGNENKGWPQLD